MFGATKIEMEVLTLLKSGERMYGLEMVKKADGALKRGTIYVYLGRMENKEWIESEAEKDPREAGLPRRRYWITGKGSRVLDRAMQTKEKFMSMEEGFVV